MSAKHLRIAIAFLGCALAVLSAVLGGVRKARLEGHLQTTRAELAALSAEISRRDRLFDIANASRGAWEQSRIALRVLYATTQQIYGPAVESVENMIADTLAWGSEAASGNPLSSKESGDVDKAARLIAADEARRAKQVKKSPIEGQRLPSEAELAAAVSLVTSLRQKHIRDFWDNREAVGKQQEELRAQASRLEASVRRVESMVVSLQIAGLLIVLLKDFVPDKKTSSA
jgi:hypothetical protein